MCVLFYDFSLLKWIWWLLKFLKASEEEEEISVCLLALVSSSLSSDFSPSHLLMSMGLGTGCINSALYQQEIAVAILGSMGAPCLPELSTVKHFIQPPRSFERRLLSTLTITEAPFLQLAMNFQVCSDIFSSDSRDFLWSCEMQSCKRTGAKYTFLSWYAARQTGAVSTPAFSSAERVESFWRRWGLVQLIRQLSLFWYLTDHWTSLCLSCLYTFRKCHVTIAEEAFHPPGRLWMQNNVVGFHLYKATAFKELRK